LALTEKKIVFAVTCPNCHKPFDISITVPTTTELRALSPTETLSLFPEELRTLLRVEDAGDRYIIKPTKWLGKERFNVVMAMVRQKNGEYIPAGKDSHFTIPKRYIS